MGSFSVADPFIGSICGGDPTVFVVLVPNTITSRTDPEHSYTEQIFLPLGVIHGVYDDYGRLKDVKDTGSLRAMARHFKKSPQEFLEDVFGERSFFGAWLHRLSWDFFTKPLPFDSFDWRGSSSRWSTVDCDMLGLTCIDKHGLEFQAGDLKLNCRDGTIYTPEGQVRNTSLEEMVTWVETQLGPLGEKAAYASLSWRERRLARAKFAVLRQRAFFEELKECGEGEAPPYDRYFTRTEFGIHQVWGIPFHFEATQIYLPEQGELPVDDPEVMKEILDLGNLLTNFDLVGKLLEPTRMPPQHGDETAELAAAEMSLELLKEKLILRAKASGYTLKDYEGASEITIRRVFEEGCITQDGDWIEASGYTVKTDKKQDVRLVREGERYLLRD